MLIDNHGREINYLRLAVTDRCNLRCLYCMPESGIQYAHRKCLLTLDEMYRVVRIFSNLGISKLRITGGEPFLRKGIMNFLKKISNLKNIEEINITTNGTVIGKYIPELENMGIKSINLSIDSLDRERFKSITNRDKFDEVMKTYQSILDSSIDIKVNAVVMQEWNIDDIYPMIELGRNDQVSIRFIEEMPFNGKEGKRNHVYWSMKKILDYINQKYDFEKLKDIPSSTSINYKIPGFIGTFGIIAAYTRTFCGSCNRIRVTPQGQLKTCLYDDGRLSIRNILRNTTSDDLVQEKLFQTIGNRAKDGYEAEKRRTPVSESMSTIGG